MARLVRWSVAICMGLAIIGRLTGTPVNGVDAFFMFVAFVTGMVEWLTRPSTADMFMRKIEKELGRGDR